MQCRAEIPHLIKVQRRMTDMPVNFISINTRDPHGQAKAEIKKYKMKYDVFYGRGENINRDFKVAKLPRLILVRPDGTIYKDVLFMKAPVLQREIEQLLEELPTSTGINTTVAPE
ncbi:MAG: TlpA disulfide reductase family protein [Candidatus Electryoneaceae bacterium]|nr:TlpA disulfide reductase family protein [Candidatus Electryoneaceae bacterium]